jgi:hypothetical protein
MLAVGEEEGEHVCMPETEALAATEAEVGLVAATMEWFEQSIAGTVEQGVGDVEEEVETNEKAAEQEREEEAGGTAEKDREAQEAMARLNGLGTSADSLNLPTQQRQERLNHGKAPADKNKKPAIKPLAFFAASFMLMLLVSAAVQVLIVVGKGVRDILLSSTAGDGSEAEKGGLIARVASLEDDDGGGYDGRAYGGGCAPAVGGRTSTPAMLRQGTAVQAEEAAYGEDGGASSRLEGDTMSGLMMA